MSVGYIKSDICKEFTDFSLVKMKNIENVLQIPLLMRDLFNAYSKEIRMFFNGKENRIREIYSAIRTDSFPYNKIESINCVEANATYDDYVKGLVIYVTKVLNLHDNDQIAADVIKRHLAKMTNRDDDFIHRLVMGDTNSGSCIEPESINDAMKNVEMLIEIDKTFESYITTASDLCNIASQNTSKNYQNECKDAVILYVTSVARFNCMIIEAIFDCYNKIDESLNTRTPVNGVPIKEELQVF